MGTVKEGDLFRIETVEWTGGQIKDDDSAEDVKNVDLTKVHLQYLVQQFIKACRNALRVCLVPIALLRASHLVYFAGSQPEWPSCRNRCQRRASTPR